MLMFYLQMIETDEDRSKFEQIYMEYRGLMHRVAYEILEHQEDAEDAVHQAFLYFAENIQRIEIKTSSQTKSYFVTLVECRALNIKELRNKRNEVSFDEIVGISTEYTGPNQLAKCVSKLPARYREILTLKYQFGFDNKAIAKMMSITEINVRKLEQRAKDRLFKFCRKEGLL